MASKIMAACDCETDPFEFTNDGTPQLDIKPFIWGYYTGKKYKKFNSTAEFVYDVKRRPWNFYAHNGGKFDYMFLMEFVEDIQSVKIINGRISTFKIGKATFYDSYNVLPVALKELQKDDFDYTKLKKSARHLHTEEIEAYLKSDCVYLHKYLTELFGKYDKKLTLASSAMSEFEKVVEEMPKSDSTYHDKYKEYYFGGRVTHFELGVIEAKENEEIKIYDINSAYPTAMRYQHPYGTKEGRDILHLKTLPKLDSDIEKCFIELECYAEGCFVYRPAKNASLEFPHAKKVWKVTGWEYLAALRTNSISDIKIINVTQFLDCRDFAPYVDKFYAEKLKAGLKIKSGDEAGKSEYLMAKLYLNSVYGKFAQDPRKYKNYLMVTPEQAFDYCLYGSVLVGKDELICNPEFKSDRDYDIRQVNQWSIVREYENGLTMIESPSNTYEVLEENGNVTIKENYEFFNVATAASITGWVRAYMWESICKVDRPLYCDTDSIACFDGSKLPLGNELGQWDCELDNIYKMAIAGKKLYAAFQKGGKTKIACKGVQLDGKQIELVAKGEEVKYIKMSPVFSISKPPAALHRYVNRQDRKEINQAKRKLMESKSSNKNQKA